MLRRERYVAKTTIATTTKAKTYSVAVSPLALLFAVSRAKTKPLGHHASHIRPWIDALARVALASTSSPSTTSMSARSTFDNASIRILRYLRLSLTTKIIAPENASELPAQEPG